MRALVVGASGGIGSALAAELAARGWAVTGLSRRADGLDVTDEASVARCLSALEPGFDLVIVATGALEIGAHRPEKSLRALDPAALAAQFAVNAMGPALVLKHALRLMPRDRRAVFAALSARVGSIGDNALGGWYSYRAAKAALNQLIHTAAIEVALKMSLHAWRNLGQPAKTRFVSLEHSYHGETIGALAVTDVAIANSEGDATASTVLVEGPE